MEDYDIQSYIVHSDDQSEMVTVRLKKSDHSLIKNNYLTSKQNICIHISKHILLRTTFFEDLLTYFDTSDGIELEYMDSFLIKIYFGMLSNIKFSNVSDRLISLFNGGKDDNCLLKYPDHNFSNLSKLLFQIRYLSVIVKDLSEMRDFFMEY